MKLHDCEAIEIESVEEVSIGLESVKKALRKCQETIIKALQKLLLIDMPDGLRSV